MTPEAEIMISRPSHRFVDRLMAYTVWIDGQDVGAVHDGETQGFSVPPGIHQVRLGMYGRVHGSGRIWKSQSQEIDAKSGDVVHLTCSPKALTGIVRPLHRLDLSKAATVR